HGRKAVDNQPQRLSRGVRIDGPDDHAVVGYIKAVGSICLSMPLLLSENDVRAVLSMDALIASMEPALARFSAGAVQQPLRTVLTVGDGHAFYAVMPAFMREPAALGTKLVTVFGSNAERGLPTHLTTIVLLDAQTDALQAILDGRYITEARTAAVSAVSAKHLARRGARTLAIFGSGVQARSHLEALTRVRDFAEIR